MISYDLVFVGHMCYDEIIPFRGEAMLSPGSAVYCSAMAAARVGKRVAVVVKMSPADAHILEPMRAIGIDTFLAPSDVTTQVRVEHFSDDVDVRTITLVRNAGFLQVDEFPALTANLVHLAGITDREFTLDFVQSLHQRGYRLALDMQALVRHVDPISGEVSFGDVPFKTTLLPLLDKVKLDVVEAEYLTGTRDLDQAARRLEAWGSRETVITRSDGVLVRYEGESHFARFTHRSVIGRTGRGDTTFGAYLAWRQAHGVAEALQFAAALVSIKLESPGPFKGTLADVLRRLVDVA